MLSARIFFHQMYFFTVTFLLNWFGPCMGTVKFYTGCLGKVRYLFRTRYGRVILFMFVAGSTLFSETITRLDFENKVAMSKVKISIQTKYEI